MRKTISSSSCSPALLFAFLKEKLHLYNEYVTTFCHVHPESLRHAHPPYQSCLSMYTHITQSVIKGCDAGHSHLLIRLRSVTDLMSCHHSADVVLLLLAAPHLNCRLFFYLFIWKRPALISKYLSKTCAVRLRYRFIRSQVLLKAYTLLCICGLLLSNICVCTFPTYIE